MVNFNIIEVDTVESQCSIGNDGCIIEISRVCSQCGAFLCGNKKCGSLHPIGYLENEPKAIFCSTCKPVEDEKSEWN